MNPLIRLLMGQPRAILTLFLIAVLGGMWTYLTVAREADPDIDIPVFVVSVGAPGVAARDGERLIGRPLETALRGIEGIDNTYVSASDGAVSVVCEFDITVDNDTALRRVRIKVDEAKVEFPAVADDPRVIEASFALFPILVIGISGDVPEKTLVRHAQTLQDELKTISSVLSADISGKREEQIEIIISPAAISAYGLSLGQVLNSIQNNNLLIAAGEIATPSGRSSVKLSGLLNDAQDVATLPLKSVDGEVVRVQDVASVRRTFTDRDSFTRINGTPALAISIVKRAGDNILDTIRDVKNTVDTVSEPWPETIKVETFLDRSTDINGILFSLQNSVVTAIIIVMIVSFLGLGFRPSILIALSIPSSFALGFLVLSLLGYTINVMVLFGLVLTVGMLVDNVIVISEYADRKMQSGEPRREAYALAASRMLRPVLSSTATTLAAFLPLLLWPGVAGQFMRLIPIMVIIVLSCSYITAMVAVPIVGAQVGKARRVPRHGRNMRYLEEGDPAFKITDLPWFQRGYAHLNRALTRFPILPIIGVIAMVVGILATYIARPTGVEFFVETEARQSQVFVSALGDLSREQEVKLVDRIEAEIRKVEGVAITFTRTGAQASSNIVETPAPRATIGIISVEFLPFEVRRPSSEIIRELETVGASFAGVAVEVRAEEQGPPVGKDIQIRVSGPDYEQTIDSVARVAEVLSQPEMGLRAIDDNLSLPGISWQVDVDREAAARFGTSVAEVGAFIQMATSGYRLGTVRPDDSQDELEVRARFPEDERSLHRLGSFPINTALGQVPLSQIMSARPVASEGTILRTNGRFSGSVRADIKTSLSEDGSLSKEDPAVVKARIDTALSEAGLPESIALSYEGADPEQEQSEAFVQVAGLYAMAIMLIILLLQFKSFGESLLTLLTVIFSVSGVFLGMLVTGQKFSVIMTGVGVVGLAGIVVNNAIILIDTYNRMRGLGLDAREAALRASILRLRPILLTTITTVCGLIPLALKVNFNIAEFAIQDGGVTALWWVQLATAMIWGIMFATVLTLVFVPAALVQGDQVVRFVFAAGRRIKRLGFWLFARKGSAATKTSEKQEPV